jgi:uncharacterized protein (UPF0261 family)
MSAASRSVLVIATLDTKGEEIAYVRDRLAACDCPSVVMDAGILGEPHGIRPDIGAAEVATAGGHSLEEVRAAGSRGAAVELMLGGVRARALELWREGRIAAVLCFGGAEGAALGAAAMQALPVGVPKLLVSPSASGRRAFAPFVGASDTLVMHSVVDIIGLNPISRVVFDNAAAAIAGMLRDAGRPAATTAGSGLGITMLGQTTPAVQRMQAPLRAAGWEPVVFHANGVGGPAMERLVEEGALSAVIDFTLSELANEINDGIHATGPERLRAAGGQGIPQVVVPGCVDFFNQGARETVPARYLARKTYFHNPTATLVRLDAEESAELGAEVARRLAEARGPVAVVAPTRGFSLVDVEDGALWEPEADAAFLDALEQGLPSRIEFERIEAAVNEPVVADRVVARFLELAGAPAQPA